MKQNYIFILLLSTLLFTATLKAQPSITVNDLPNVGTTSYVKIDKNVDPTLSIGSSSSTAQTWDFGNLAGTLDTVAFFDPATHPAAGDFPGTTIARQASLESLLGVSLDVLGLPIELPDATAFYSVDPDGKIYNNGVNIYINVLGFDLGSQSLQAIPPDFYLAPVQLGQSNSSNAHLEKELTITAGVVATISIDLNRTATADAFGTMNLPEGLSYNVLRIKEDLTASVAANVGILGSIDTTLSLSIYRFMTPNQRYPVATISTAEQESGTVINFVEYKAAGPVGIEHTELVAGAKLTLPTNFITQQTASELPVMLQCDGVIDNRQQLEVYNLNGQKLIQQQNLEAINYLPTSALPNGTYFVVWVNENGQTIARSRFTVLK